MQKSNLQLLFICIVGLVFSLILGHTHGRGTVKVQGSFPDLYEATIAELQEGMVRGHFSSVDLVRVRLELIPQFDYLQVDDTLP